MNILTFRNRSLVGKIGNLSKRCKNENCQALTYYHKMTFFGKFFLKRCDNNALVLAFTKYN